MLGECGPRRGRSPLFPNVIPMGGGGDEGAGMVTVYAVWGWVLCVHGHVVWYMGYVYGHGV